MKHALWSFCQTANIPFLPDEPMSRHTTFHIGGTADALISPEDTRQLAAVLCYLQKTHTPRFILGQGSNLLVSDKGIRGAVVRLDRLRTITFEEGMLVAEAGALLSKVCTEAAVHGKGGLAFAYGIPGSIGGALRMNAGAYDGEMAQVVAWAECMDDAGRMVRLSGAELAFSYRHSVFCDDPRVITRVAFRLTDETPETILAAMEDYMARRRAKQPLEYPSAGSTFKRPEGHYAGRLIESCGMKGFAIGDACVSEKHAGFVINRGHATAKEVRQLIAAVREKVLWETGVTLEPEVIPVGEE